ncbi:MAG: hypothetical protein FJX11_06280 [Alphaproteobacteria bacterium]|nr:hypothetical protein [Alphaproteobacteria bacterium]
MKAREGKCVLVAILVALVTTACQSSSVDAPPPSVIATAAGFLGAPETTDQKLYRTGLKYLGEYNAKDNQKAMYCGETETHIGCTWVYYRDTPDIADEDARRNCEEAYGLSCQQFAVNGQLAPWAAEVADSHDPAGAAARQAAFERDRAAGGGGAALRQAIDGGILVLSGVQSGVGAMQRAATAQPSDGYSQRGAFVDCAKAGLSPDCATRAANMNSAGPGAVRSTYGQGSGTPAPTSRSTITGLK